MAVHRGVPHTEDPADERRQVVGQLGRSRPAPLAMLLLGLSWPLLTLVLLFVLVDVSNWSLWSILVLGCWLCSGVLVVLPSTERQVVRTLFRYRNPVGDDRRALDAAWGAVADRAGIDPATYSLWVADWNMIDSGSSFGRTIVVSRAALETLPPEQLRAMLAHQLGRHHSGLPLASGLTYWYGLPARVAARICVTVGRVARGTVLTGVVLAVLVPLWVVLVTSLASRETINEAGGLVVVPREIDFSAYAAIFSGGLVTQALWISTVITVLGTAVSLSLTVLAAYGLSRPGSVGHRGLLFYFLLTFLIYPGMVPSYLVVTGLGLKNSIWALILPTAISVFNLVVIRAFFQNIPAELMDSARIDGAGEFRILARIVLPLSRAVVAVVGLFYAVGYWSAWFNASLYLNDQNMLPLQNVMIQLVQKQEAPVGLGQAIKTGELSGLAVQMAVMVMALLPVAVLSPFVQKHFKKGMLTGAVKG